MKEFFRSFLAGMAAIWISALIMIIGLFIIIGAIAAASASGSSTIKVQDKTVLVFNLDGTVTDRNMPRDVLKELSGQDETTLPLNSIIKAIDEAATDNRIAGIYLKCNGLEAGMAQTSAIVNALNRFKASGKWIASYGDNYNQADYVLASVADSIFINPSGSVDIHGLQATTLFFKDMLDNIGVEAQVVKVGTYKSAVEPFMLDGMSEASRLQQEVYLGNIWNQLVKSMAEGRKLTPEKINQMADTLPAFLPAEVILKEGLVDKLVYEREVDAILNTMAGNTDNLEDNRPAPKYADILEYAALFDINKVGNSKKNIAVIYAVGDITEDGKDGIVSEELVPVILDIADDDNIDALLLRVNSGGGSAYASEQIWDALRHFKEKTGKPFYVSMGDYAASGGYYISCGADKIFADPLTLTGSIGIFGIIPSAEKLINDKLGVHTGTVSTNPQGDLPTLFNAMTPRQREALQRNVDSGYELFTSRVAAGRKMSVDSVKSIAEGRVWDGQSALKIGLVDQLGDLNEALDALAKQIDADGYNLKIYPDIKMEWWQQLMNIDSQMKERAISTRIPYAMPLYNTIESLGNLSPLQCRMDYIIIK